MPKEIIKTKNIFIKTKVPAPGTYKLIKKALPGAFTFVLNANNTIPKLFKNNRKTIGIRVPNHNIPRNIVELLGNPIGRRNSFKSGAANSAARGQAHSHSGP